MMLKVELHTHTSDDPVDRISHSSRDLIDRAAALGYDALAITLHDSQLDPGPLAVYARERGILLIPGIERTIRGRHVLLLNFSREGAEGVCSFEDLARLKTRESGLVVAPHPFFPSRKCLLGLMNRHAHLFDAVEINAMFTRSFNFNIFAERWAARYSKPMIGNGDVHRLEQLGTTYSLVDADRTPESICNGIKAGRVRVVSAPLSWPAALRIFARIVAPTLGFTSRSPQPARAAS
jgi:predicted metal-dependent phosphoesterase TrpH